MYNLFRKFANMLPEKLIRKDIYDVLSEKYPVYDVDTPIDKIERGRFIKIVQSQKQQTDLQKECYSWLVNVQLDLYSVNEFGFYSTLGVDEMENDLRGIYRDLPNVYVEDIMGITTRDSNYDSETHSINRRIVNIIYKVSSDDTRKSYRG